MAARLGLDAHPRHQLAGGKIAVGIKGAAAFGKTGAAEFVVAVGGSLLAPVYVIVVAPVISVDNEGHGIPVPTAVLAGRVHLAHHQDRAVMRQFVVQNLVVVVAEGDLRKDDFLRLLEVEVLESRRDIPFQRQCGAGAEMRLVRLCHGAAQFGHHRIGGIVLVRTACIADIFQKVAVHLKGRVHTAVGLVVGGAVDHLVP